MNSVGHVWEAPSCGVRGATIDPFQNVNFLMKRPDLIQIEETIQTNQVPGSC